MTLHGVGVVLWKIWFKASSTVPDTVRGLLLCLTTYCEDATAIVSCITS